MLPAVLGINNYHYLRGGSERYFLELGRLLAARGHRVLHLSTADPRNEPAPGPAAFVEPNDLARPGAADVWRFHYSRRARAAVQGLLAQRPDLAHLHIYHGQLTASILAPLRAAGIPLVQTLHEYKLLCPVHTLVSRGTPCEACGGSAFWHALPRRCNRGSTARTLVNVSESYLSRALGAWSAIDHFLAVSEFLRGKMIAHGLEPGRVSTLHNFVDAGAHEPADGPGEHALFLGRLEREKGVFTLLAAAAEVPELPLVLAGDGGARAELERALATPALAHVRLVGFARGAELVRLVRGARCVVVPSEWPEPFGLVALEAMAHARPVLAAASGGLPELVRQGEDGFLVPPGDAPALAERLRWFAGHGAEAAALGARARRSVEERFSPARHHEALRAVYARVTGARA